MKLAEALIERADLKRKTDTLRSRLYANARVQEGSEPSEEPRALLKEIDADMDRLEHLIVCINKTNAATDVGGATVTELIAHKDALLHKISLIDTLLRGGREVTERATHTEIRIIPTFDIKAVQKKSDALSKELRETDAKIQAANWQTELIEN